MATLTLLDIAARNNNDALVGLVEDVTTYAPEWGIIPAVSRPGTTYNVLRRTSFPTGAFRSVNAANTTVASKYVTEVKQMFFWDTPLQIDEALLQADKATAGDLLAQEAAGAISGTSIAIGTQLYYGDTASGDAKGFVGLQKQSVGKWPTGGTTSTTSAYLVWLNPQGVAFTVGNDGAMIMPPWTRAIITPTSTTQKTVWATNLSFYIGLQVASAQSVWRISGIADASTYGLTDARVAGLLSKVPLNRRNGLRLFMNRTAAYTLQKARATLSYVADSGRKLVNDSGAFFSMPTESNGIPITVTDSLLDTETNAGTADTYAEE